LAWYPRREAHTDPSAMHRVRLADSASSSVVAAAAGKYDKLRRIVVQARGVADSAGARVEVRDGDIVVADESLTLTDGRAAATLTLPMPAIGAPRPNLSVNIAGAHTADLDLPDADGLRARELTEAELHFHPSVFASDDFPGCDFEESRRVESLIGPYTIETQFYDAQYAIAEKATEPGRYGAIVTIRAEGGATYTRYRTLFRSPDTPSWIEEFVRHVPASIGLPPEYGIPEDAHRVHASAIGRHIKYALRDSFYDNDGIAPLLAGLYETTEPSRPSDASNDLVAMDRQWWVGLKRRLYNTAEAFPDPVARPERVDGPAAPVIREGSAEAAGMTADAAANIDAVCREWAGDSDEGFAVLVARHGVIVLHDAYGERDGRPMSVNHPSWMASITKLLGGTLMMMLVDQGLVDLDATMDTYLPAFRDIDVQTPMTVRHLYTHTNGLWGHWGDELHDFEEVISEYYPYLEIGVRHGYNGAGCALAGKIIESVSGEGLPQFYAKHLLDPLGISVTAATDMSWQTRSMPMDMARIGQMLLNKGQYGDLRFFRPETFEKMLPVSLVPLLGPETEIEWGIGATWFKDPGLGEGTFAHGAASAATLRIDPENDMVIVMTRNAGGENFGEYHPKFLAAIVDGIVDSAD
jgi:CubicO group peptidase (beta-lactamase class C family)